MKIVPLKDFLALPAGTVYFNYVEHNFDLGGTPALMIKGATLEDGFYEATCVSTDTALDVRLVLGKASKNGTSFLLNPQTAQFDGTFRDEQLYAVYEPTDAKQLITRLLKAFGDSGLLDKGMISMVDQVINVTGNLRYEPTSVFEPDDGTMKKMYETALEPRFECTNLHTGDVHHLTQDEVGELLETGIAPTRPNNWGNSTLEAPRIPISKASEEDVKKLLDTVDRNLSSYKALAASVHAVDKPDVIIHESPTFLRDMESRINKGASVVFTDSKGAVHSSSTPILVSEDTLVLLEKVSDEWKPTPTIVPAPNTRDLTLKADAETANRRCVNIVRPNKHGANVNYGRLAVGHLEGLPFVGQVETLIRMGVPCLYVERIPKFVEDISLSVKWETLEGVIYALEKEDLAPLGVALSKNHRAVMAVHMGCYLQVWGNGEVVSPHKTIDHFVHRLTKEEIENSKF